MAHGTTCGAWARGRGHARMSEWQRTRTDSGSGRMRPRQFAHLDGHDAYEVLGVDADASRSEIEAARRGLVKVLHPDRPGGDAAKMSLVNAAADILLDTAKRADYDAYLDGNRPRAAPTARPTPGPRRPVRPESAA